MKYNESIDKFVQAVNSLDTIELYEMAKIGQVNGLYIIVWTNDAGWIPHFHVFDHPNPSCATLDACIKIETPEYFKHGGHTDILQRSDIKRIIKFLKSERRPGRTYWDILLETWNLNNSDAEIPEDLPMPDYTQLNQPTI